MTHLPESSELETPPLHIVKEADPSWVIGQARTHIFHMFLEVEKRLKEEMSRKEIRGEWDIAYQLHNVEVAGNGEAVIKFNSQISRKLASTEVFPDFSRIVQFVFSIDNALLVEVTQKPLLVRAHGPEFTYRRS